MLDPTKLNYSQVRDIFLEKGYKFRTGKYNLNHIGWRNQDLMTVDQFNDWRSVCYEDSYGNGHHLIVPATTKPGLSYLKEVMGNPEGTGILIPGQYLDCWTIGIHGKSDPHLALLQYGYGIFKVYRDANKDGKLDFSGKIYVDVTGLDDHRATQGDIFKVGPYSAACQVKQEDKEHDVFMALCKRQEELYKPIFDYTLFQLN